MAKQRQSTKLEFTGTPGVWERITKALQTDVIHQVAMLMGLSDPAVWQWKHTGQLPSLDNLMKIAKLGNTSIEWLVTGEATQKTGLTSESSSESASEWFNQTEQTILKELAKNEGRSLEKMITELVREALKTRGFVLDQPEKAITLDYFGGMVPVPLLGEIADGAPVVPFEPKQMVMIVKTFQDGDPVHALRVRGDSLKSESFHDGDLLIVIRETEIPNGQFVVALLDENKATVKRCYQEKDQLRLQSGNPLVKPLILPKAKVEIQGLVIGVQRSPAEK